MKKYLYSLLTLVFLCLLATSVILYQEIQSSKWQASWFWKSTSKMSYHLMEGQAPALLPAPQGPYDLRMGYAQLPQVTRALKMGGYEITRQAWADSSSFAWSQIGFPLYHEKGQSGLQILDRYDRLVYGNLYPKFTFESFENIPPVIWQILLFIEDRQLLDSSKTYMNPAVNWERLSLAVLEKAATFFIPNHAVPGGSTLATQMEKYRHSPEGRTVGGSEKIKQMLTASARTYREGFSTLNYRKRLVTDYINSVPLASKGGYGEVQGLLDGLWYWYGTSPDEARRILVSEPQTEDEWRLKAKITKQVMSLFLAHKRPSYFLLKHPDKLENRIQNFIPLMAKEGIIEAKVAGLAKQTQLDFNKNKNFSEIDLLPLGSKKGTNSIRTRLQTLFGGPDYYAMDRLDAEVRTTLDIPSQIEVTEMLRNLADTSYVAKSELNGEHLLGKGNPKDVVYSLTLFEKGDDANRLLIQTDNYNQPLNINEGSKLDLGSTAKLRLMVHYLEIIEQTHNQYKNLVGSELDTVQVETSDKITRWVLDYIKTASDTTLHSILAEAVMRKYSANPAEAFYTGGGLHTFVNFHKDFDHQEMTLYEALINSTNLPFVRLLRDMVKWHIAHFDGGRGRILSDPNHPLREEYLNKFADQEGRVFINKFWQKYHLKSKQEIETLLLSSTKPKPARIASLILSINPQIPFNSFSQKLLDYTKEDQKLSDKYIQELFNKYQNDKFSLNDRGFISKVHPLEMQVAHHLWADSSLSLKEIYAKTEADRIEVYSWLKKVRDEAQNLRIQQTLEQEAFSEIHKAYQRMGYPFGFLIPSYATALGASGDKPAALADLMGILVNDGKKLPSTRINTIRLGVGTPYETHFDFKPKMAEQVLNPDIARTMKELLLGVVEKGTARRIHGRVKDAANHVLEIGGKTGTGDHRLDIYGPGGVIKESRVVDRTATFVFFIGDKWFGTLTAFVHGERAANYDFTSALPVTVLKMVAPQLKSVFEPGHESMGPRSLFTQNIKTSNATDSVNTHTEQVPEAR